MEEAQERKGGKRREIREEGKQRERTQTQRRKQWHEEIFTEEEVKQISSEVKGRMGYMWMCCQRECGGLGLDTANMEQMKE